MVNNKAKHPAWFGKYLACYIGQDKRTNSFLLRKEPIGDVQIGSFHFSNPAV